MTRQRRQKDAEPVVHEREMPDHFCVFHKEAKRLQFVMTYHFAERLFFALMNEIMESCPNREDLPDIKALRDSLEEGIIDAEWHLEKSSTTEKLRKERLRWEAEAADRAEAQERGDA